MYEKSFMHRDTVTQVAVAQDQDFLITGSIDGHLKFWKKTPTGIEFAKHYRAHVGSLDGALLWLMLGRYWQLDLQVNREENRTVQHAAGLTLSPDNSLLVSISRDKTVKVLFRPTLLVLLHGSYLQPQN